MIRNLFFVSNVIFLFESHFPHNYLHIVASSRPQGEFIYVIHSESGLNNGCFLVPLQDLSNTFRQNIYLQKSQTALNGAVQSNLHFVDFPVFKIVYTTLWLMTYFSPYNNLYRDATLSLLYRIYITNVQAGAILHFSQFRTLHIKLQSCNIHKVESLPFLLYSICNEEVSLKSLLSKNCYLLSSALQF